ncbi:MAG: polysaccharide deacetylase family protein [Candidatus Omnitrophica bacterium]|nr:polysaccharide deacetylase family protein [Candidatus Omnitrophota bacterium]
MKKSPLAPKSIVVTFDDGLKEHFENALPVLEKMRIPFIFFVNSKPYSDNKALTVHMVHYLRSIIAPGDLLNNIQKASMALFKTALPLEDIMNSMPLHVYPYDDADSKLIKYIFNFYLPKDKSATIAGHIFQAYCDEAEFCKKFYMAADELRMVHDKYKAIGLHGHSHVALTGLSEKEAHREIRLCKNTIQEIVSDEIICLSYPFGYSDSVSLREERIAIEAGLIFCFTMEMCFNRDVNIAPHLLGRINNNEALGHEQAAFKYADNDFVITDKNRMKYCRERYYSDCPDFLKQL